MKIKYYLLAVPVAFFLIFCTSYTLIQEIPYSFKRMVEAGILTIAAGLFVIIPQIRNETLQIVQVFNRKSPVIVWSAAGILFWGVLSAAFSAYPRWAFLEMAQYFLLLVLFLLVVSLYLEGKERFEKFVLVMFGGMAALYLLNVTVSYAYSFFIPQFPLWPETDFFNLYSPGRGWIYPQPFSNFVNFRFFNHIQTWTLPLMTLLVIRIPLKYRAYSILAFILSCGWWMLVFASDARGTLLASVAAFATIIVLYRSHVVKWIKVHSAAAVSGFLLYLIFFKITWFGTGTGFIRTTSAGRWELWEYALQLISDNPFLGVGPMHYAVFNTSVNSATPHNIYLQIFSEWGIIAGFLFLAFIFAGLFNWLRQNQACLVFTESASNKVNTRIALTASLIAAGIHGLFTSILTTPLSQVIMVIVLGWTAGMAISDQWVKTEIKNSIILKYGLVTLSLVCLSIMIGTYIKDVPELPQNRLDYLQKTQGQKLYPRYWDQGIIGFESTEQESSNLITTEK